MHLGNLSEYFSYLFLNYYKFIYLCIPNGKEGKHSEFKNKKNFEF